MKSKKVGSILKTGSKSNFFFLKKKHYLVWITGFHPGPGYEAGVPGSKAGY
jgi:hypothetical protein